jgi:hypothetical protein
LICGVDRGFDCWRYLGLSVAIWRDYQHLIGALALFAFMFAFYCLYFTFSLPYFLPLCLPYLLVLEER